jgi:hypothetical protein
VLSRERQPDPDHLLERLGVRQRPGVLWPKPELGRQAQNDGLGLRVVARDEHRRRDGAIAGGREVLVADRVEGLDDPRAGQQLGEVLARASARIAAEPVHRTDDNPPGERLEPDDPGRGTASGRSANATTSA